MVFGGQVKMNGNDWLLLMLYLLIAEFIAPHSCARTRYGVKNRCVAVSVPNGKMVVRHRGRVGRFICDSGYKLIGDKIATCHEGTWDTMAQCVKDVECPKVMPKVKNGKMVPFSYVYFKVSCNPGFRVPDGIQSIFPCEQFFDPEMKPPVCQLTAEHFCDFETDMCRWNNTVPYFPWIRQQNATPSHALRTGPDGDHTYGTGHYLYIEASGLASNEEKFAKLVRRFWKVDTPEVCFVFWYHMYGFNTGTLDVYVDLVKVFTKTGNLGDKWRKGIIQKLPSDRDFYISMVATTGNGYAGDIAIDDIGLVNSTDCTKTLMIETSCKNRCFEFETNSTLCKCSSECLIESNCCPDFVQICGADAPKSTASSEIPESTLISSSDVGYSTTEVDFVSTSEGSSTFYPSSSDEGSTPSEPNDNSVTARGMGESSSQETSATGFTDSMVVGEQSEETNSVIKITETPKPAPRYTRPITRYITKTRHIIRSNYSDAVGTSEQSNLEVESTPPPHTSPMISTLSNQDLFTFEEDIARTADGGNSGLESFTPTSLMTPSSTIKFHMQKDFTTSYDSIAVVTTEIHDYDTLGIDVSTKSQLVTNHKPATVSRSSVTQTNSTSWPPYAGTSVTLQENQSAPTEVPTFTNTVVSTIIPPSTEAVKTLETTPPLKLMEEITSTTKTTESTIPTVQETSKIIPHNINDNISHAHSPSTFATKEENQNIDEVTEPETYTWESWEEFTSRPTNKNAVKPSLGPYKRRMTYVPKGRFTFSAVKSETKTSTYVSIVAGILIFLSAAVVAGYVFRRRRSNLFRGSTEESDVLYMTSDEILDFNLARRPPSQAPTAHSSSQQMLCQTEY